MDYTQFANLANEMSIDVEKCVFDKLIVYFHHLTDWNTKMNLTTITEEKEVFLLHFLDSALAIHSIEQNASVCDVGTGAGFPGVVLKLFRPDIKLTLMDSLNKRILFLQELTTKLGITADCIHTRAEDAGNNKLYRDTFDIVTSRALAKLNTLYEYTLPLVKIGGKLIAYKANCQEEIEQSKHVPSILGAKLESTQKFILPEVNAARTLIICKKLKATPKNYPRGKNKERELPL